MNALVVLAKAPVPGRAKTRLCPPLSAEQAADLAAAAITDTLDAVDAVPDVRRALVLDGDPTGWDRPGWSVHAQRAGGLGARLEGAFADVEGPALLVGMDTPQVTPELLLLGLDALSSHDAVLGLAPDGGYWAIGFRVDSTGLFDDVPMSTAETGARQLDALRAAGLCVALLPELRDVDTYDDALAVARLAPRTHFAAALTA
jgi:rSAM/selenodomain-associated transferase 1